MHPIKARPAAVFLAFLFSSFAVAGTKPAIASAPSSDALLATMNQELTRAKSELAKADPAPYFLSYSVVDHRAVVIAASEGAILSSASGHQRQADVSVRVGSSKLDNTHGQSRYSGLTSGTIPLENDRDAIARILWRLTDREYKKASQAYLRVKANTEVRAKEEDDSPDFSTQPAQVHVEDPSAAAVAIDRKAWEENVRRISAHFRQYPQVQASAVVLQQDDIQHYFVSSEGSRSVAPEKVVRLMIEAETQADDGMQLLRVESFLASTPEKLPSENEIAAKIDKMVKDLHSLQEAKIAEPFSGPALLSGRAAAVFFHEVLGHRLEGQRQRGDEEGQTFTKKVNQQVLPEFLSVADDPTLHQLNGIELAGWYAADDEGEPAQHVNLIQNGILRNFLMSRIPVKGFLDSNGHGRSQPGYMPVGRQGNLIVESSYQVPEASLRQQFIAEVKKQGKPYGLYFEDIEGGFTLTNRQLPQAFQVLPVMVWRVYADGRPDELVRGVDIVGTPLAALNHILVTGDAQRIFNGICGAESGNVPVSAAAPAMLFSEIEVQRKEQGHDRPPILPPPDLAPLGAQSKSAGGN